MIRRRMSNKGKKEYFKEFTSTGSQTWTVPSGCTSVDAFVVGGGANGSGGNWNSAASGGAGGACNTYNNITVTPGASITVNVGGIASQSYFKNSSYASAGSGGVSGGVAGSGTNNTAVNGHAGTDGSYAFGANYPNRYPNRYGASGGGGGFEQNTSGLTGYGGAGGSYGGGAGGDSLSNNASGWSSSLTTYNGHAATFYGAGGGGGAKWAGAQKTSSGGAGYQGIVIIHYYAY